MRNRPVAFKRKSDGKFITAIEIDDRVFLKFTDSPISDPNVQHQVYPVPRTVCGAKGEEEKEAIENIKEQKEAPPLLAELIGFVNP
uniref:Uncharacterized protein n=1 Tax=Cannabis sativa TaxID=3483 RepID=A0A803PCI7_CANSA